MLTTRGNLLLLGRRNLSGPCYPQRHTCKDPKQVRQLPWQVQRVGWVSQYAKLKLYCFWKDPAPQQKVKIYTRASERPWWSTFHTNLPDQLSLSPWICKSPDSAPHTCNLSTSMGNACQRDSPTLVGWVTWNRKIGRNSKRDPASPRRKDKISSWKLPLFSIRIPRYIYIRVISSIFQIYTNSKGN